MAEVAEQLLAETATRDEWRARRYVDTVRPAMVAFRYGCGTEEGERRGEVLKSEEGVDHGKAGNVITPEEGEGGAEKAKRLTMEEGSARAKAALGAPVTAVALGGIANPAAASASIELGGRVVPDRNRAAQVRLARKAKERGAKKQRVERALQREAACQRVNDDVGQVVARLDNTCRERRQQQAEAARGELEERREQRRTEQQTRAQRIDQRAHVSLVQRQAKAAAKVARSSGVEADDGLPTAVMEIEGVKHAVKWDSCARYTVAGTDWMQRGERVRGPAPVDYVEGVGGFLLDVIGVWAFDMRNVFGQTVSVTACIIEGCTTEFLMGVDFLKKHKASMDFDRNEVRYFERDLLVVIPFRTEGGDEGETRVAPVRMARQAKLNRRAVVPLSIAVVAPDGEQGIFVPTQNCGAVMLATTVTRVNDGKALIPAINLRGDRTRLPNKKELGVWVPLEKDMELLELNNELDPDRVDEWIASLGDTETPLDNEDEVKVGVEDSDTRARVVKLLRAYREVTTNTGDTPPLTTLDVQHHINTQGAAPIMLKRRRQAQSEEVVVDRNVSTMLRAGVIEEGNGAWGFPVVLVRKKDGEVRFCIDYRALNKVTKRDVYPLPRIDETLEALSGAQLFTTLDLRAGYWQIGVAPEDRDKTAFTTKSGLYRFVRMPFGLMNAPSTFQRMMNGVLRGLTWTTCLVYLDDIVIFTRGGVERHLVQLATVLQRLSSAGLTLKLKKCVFATHTMEYLGHELSSKGVRPVKQLITAVTEFKRPTDPVEVKRFVHLAGYYRKFVEAFGSIMAPMTKLLKKDVEWEWTEAQEFAFERVKRALTMKPLLVYPDFRLPFWLVTDASKVGLGACLMQDQGRGWQPIAFASKVNNNAESNYSITELECLAVVWAVKLFRPYLYGRMFEIVTDHAALKWLMTRPNLAGRLHRWSLTLQEYEFDITYRPGATNVVADALSRAPVATPAAVLAVVGAKRYRQSYVRPVGSAGDESKSEEDAPPTLAARQEAEAEADRMARTTPRAVTAGAAIPMSQTIPSAGQSQKGNAWRRDQQEAQAPPRRPWTRLARRQEEARAAAAGATTAGDETTREQADTEETERDRHERRPGERARSEEAAAAVGESTSSSHAIPTRPPTATTAAARRGRVRGRHVTWADPVADHVADTQDAVVPARNATRSAKCKSSEVVQKTRGNSKRSVAQGSAADLNLEQRGTDDMTDELTQETPATLQLTDTEIAAAQQRSRLVQKMLVAGSHEGMPVEKMFDLVVIHTTRGGRVILPPALWPVVFKEMHGSIWAGHLRGPHTYGRVARLYWWPGLHREVNSWVRGCQECGSRKARPREVIPPLRSLRGGDVGDRWALDVAGPFPIADGGERYVIAALEYVTRYAVAQSVTQHTAERVASFLMEEVVLRFGAFRELFTDGAPELTGRVIEQLVTMLQAKQTNPVPYRPQMIGLVERFHRSWKDCVSTFMSDEKQNDWSEWVQCAVYAYNSAPHSTVALSPNELMMGRRLRPPNELLRQTERTEAGELTQYHERLLAGMARGHQCAEQAREKEQARQARYYDRKVRQRRTFEAGDRVWVYNPPRGPRATKFVHQWMGPMRVVEPAGYENFVLQREDKNGAPELMIAHASFMVSYQSPTSLLRRAADDISQQLEHEDQSAREVDVETAGALVYAAAAGNAARAPAGSAKRSRDAAAGTDLRDDARPKLVELRRRRWRNRAGQYTLQYELRPTGAGWTRTTDAGRWATTSGRLAMRWVNGDEYEQLHRAGRVVEDPCCEEVV